MRHRYELVHECTQRKNKLIAICDELFPEFTDVFKDPNGPTALALREQFPTPQAVATAPLAEVIALRRGRGRPSNAQLMELQRLASQSIGVKDLVRQRGLVLEQRQLIRASYCCTSTSRNLRPRSARSSRRPVRGRS